MSRLRIEHMFAYGPAVALAALPRRDEHSREHLDNAARHAQPVVLAGERVLAVPGPLGARLPGGGVRRGTVVAVDGDPGAGATGIAFELAEAGIELDRFAVVRRVPPARWAAVVAALLDGISVVLTEVPAHARADDARQLLARARERGVVLVAMGPWPAEAALRLRATGSEWRGLGAGEGVLAQGDRRVHVDGRGVAPREQFAALARAG
jgi:hypothetical protein